MLLGAALVLTIIAYGMTPWSVVKRSELPGPKTHAGGLPQNAPKRNRLDWRSPLDQPARPTTEQQDWSPGARSSLAKPPQSTYRAAVHQDHNELPGNGAEPDALTRLKLLARKLLGEPQQPAKR